MEKDKNLVKTTDSMGSHLIRINGNVIGFIDDEEKAILLVKTISNTELKKITSEDAAKIFTQELRGGREVHISVRISRVWYGKNKKLVVVDTIPVSYMT